MLQLIAGEQVTLTQAEVLLNDSQDNCEAPSVVLTDATFNGSNPGDYQTTITSTDNNGNQSVCTVNVRVDMISAVHDISDLGFKVYPNPVFDYFILEGDQEIKQLQIFDAVGKEISFSNIGGQIYLNQSSGIYFGKVILNDNRQASFKITKL